MFCCGRKRQHPLHAGAVWLSGILTELQVVSKPQVQRVFGQHQHWTQPCALSQLGAPVQQQPRFNPQPACLPACLVMLRRPCLNTRPKPFYHYEITTGRSWHHVGFFGTWLWSHHEAERIHPFWLFPLNSPYLSLTLHYNFLWIPSSKVLCWKHLPDIFHAFILPSYLTNSILPMASSVCLCTVGQFYCMCNQDNTYSSLDAAACEVRWDEIQIIHIGRGGFYRLPLQRHSIEMLCFMSVPAWYWGLRPLKVHTIPAWSIKHHILETTWVLVWFDSV